MKKRLFFSGLLVTFFFPLLALFLLMWAAIGFVSYKLIKWGFK